MADSKRKKFITPPRNRVRQMQQDLRERKSPAGPSKTTQRANFNRMETEGRVGMGAYAIKPKNVDPKFQKDTNDEAIDLPMSREGSPIVTDTETGETTYGRPKDFNKGGMMECRGGGIAITGKKFQGVF
jgi:hypothetical protein